MVNLKNVLSIVFVIKMTAREWHENALASLKSFFDGHGSIMPTKSTGNPVEPSPDQPANSVFVKSTRNCGLADAFDAASKSDLKFQVFSASYVEEGGQVTLKFMLCPSHDVEWQNARPFEEMQRACRDACSMATYRTKGWNNQYLKPGRKTDHMRSLSISGDQPNWLLQADGTNVIAEEEEVMSRLVVDEEGIIKVA